MGTQAQVPQPSGQIVNGLFSSPPSFEMYNMLLVLRLRV